MNPEKIPFIADNAAELAMLESIGKLKLNPMMAIIFNRLKNKKILLPLALDAFLAQNPDVDDYEVILNETLAHADQPIGLVIDQPTKIYFAVFLAMWRSLQPFKPVEASAIPEPVAEPKPGGRGYGMNKKHGKAGDMTKPGFKKR